MLHAYLFICFSYGLHKGGIMHNFHYKIWAVTASYFKRDEKQKVTISAAQIKK